MPIGALRGHAKQNASAAVLQHIETNHDPVTYDQAWRRPYWLLPRCAWATPVTNAFLHADLGHLFFNGFTF